MTPKNKIHFNDKGLVERFWARVDRRSPSECWEWKGTRKNGPTTLNYGELYCQITKTYIKAHRVSFAIANGREPAPGLIVRHKCDNPPCVNPAHLCEGTIADNNWDTYRRGRHPYRPRTHCLSGHPMEGDNVVFLYVRAANQTYRRCRACLVKKNAKGHRVRRERERRLILWLTAFFAMSTLEASVPPRRAA